MLERSHLGRSLSSPEEARGKWIAIGVVVAVIVIVVVARQRRIEK
jgi:hypothetical protein